MTNLTDLTDRTIVLLKRAADFAATVYDSNLVEVELDGKRVSTISLELQLRELASKIERRSRTTAAPARITTNEA